MIRYRIPWSISLSVMFSCELCSVEKYQIVHSLLEWECFKFMSLQCLGETHRQERIIGCSLTLQRTMGNYISRVRLNDKISNSFKCLSVLCFLVNNAVLLEDVKLSIAFRSQTASIFRVSNVWYPITREG